MSWIQKLYNTYDACHGYVGLYEQEGQRPLLPVCHVTMDAHIEVVIDGDGNIRDASVIKDRSQAITIVPATEDSASRSGSKPASHPLADKLQYLAGDFVECGGEVTKDFEPYRKYLETLSRWCDSSFSHPKAESVLKYVLKGILIKDLAKYSVLLLGTDGKLLLKKDAKRSKDANDIFAVRNVQNGAIVRWIVETEDGSDPRTWHDETLWQSWMNYSLSKGKKEAFCYVTGDETILSRKHPKFIRKKGDNAKLISANDDEGFTFRGRFIDDTQACRIGLEASQKVHNALMWLIDRQGTVFYEDKSERTPGLAVVTWEISGKDVPQPTEELPDLLYGDLPDNAPERPEAGQQYSLLLGRKMRGYAAELKDCQGIYIIALDSASQGRLAITYYQEFAPQDYLKNIENWHGECAWVHTYRRDKDVTPDKRKSFSFIGAPAPIHIAEAVHGKSSAPKLKHQTVARLLPCIVEGRPLPRDFVTTTVRRASNRMGLYDDEDKKWFGDDEYTWHKTLSIACALFRKYTLENRKEKYKMTLDPNRTARDYLYGRLLAIADALEERALREAKEKRPTNAARYMQQFSQRPFRTWKIIHDALTPYILRLGGGAVFYKNQMAEISCLFNPDDFKSDDPLTGEYLLGYYCQRQELRRWKKDDSASEQAESDEVDSEE